MGGKVSWSTSFVGITAPNVALIAQIAIINWVSAPELSWNTK